ncbi:hypothetical protein D3C73_585910 [compost metagenome]
MPMLRVEIDNKDGHLWQVTELVSDVSWKTSRIGKASSVDLTLVRGGLYENKHFKVNPGDIIRIYQDDVPMFYGYIFTINSSRDEDIQIMAYDQMRYLLMDDFCIFVNKTATEIISKLASDYELKVGELADTGYVIPHMLEDGTKLLDMICKALDKTLIATKQLFVFYDDFGQLTLRNAEDMTVNVSLGDQSLVVDYKQKRSIDSEVYNVVQILRENKETGIRERHILQDSANIAKWGRLQLFQKVDEKKNVAQINEILNNTMALKNREQRSFSMDALGDLRIRAGCYVSVNIAELDLNERFLVESCTHKFDGAEHTMSLELMVYG